MSLQQFTNSACNPIEEKSLDSLTFYFLSDTKGLELGKSCINTLLFKERKEVAIHSTGILCSCSICALTLMSCTKRLIIEKIEGFLCCYNFFAPLDAVILWVWAALRLCICNVILALFNEFSFLCTIIEMLSYYIFFQSFIIDFDLHSSSMFLWSLTLFLSHIVICCWSLAGATSKRQNEIEIILNH